MRALLASEQAARWHYAAWVSFDARLLLFVSLVALLMAAGLVLLFGRGRRRAELAAIFLVGFVISLTLCVALLNGLAHYPVFVVEAVFPFP